MNNPSISLKNLAVALVIALFFMFIGAIIAYFPIKGYFQAELDALTPKVEQVTITDTITRYLPLEIEKRIIDTIRVEAIKHDTIWLPREQKVYEDSTYRAVVSGVSPRLDSIEVYQRTIIETKISTQKEWRKFTYGIQLGVGLVAPINSSPTFGGYVGFGVGYHF